MLRKLLAGLIIGMGAQMLLPPLFDGDFVAGDFRGATGRLQIASSQLAVAAELDEIRDRGYLIVGVKPHRPPLSFTDEDGNMSGFEIDISHRLADELLGDENAVRFVPLSNVDRLTAVLEDRVDLAIAAITLTEPRRRLVTFSDPYYLDGTAFIVRPLAEALPQISQPQRESSSTNSIQAIQDLRLGQIAVLNRSSAVAHVRYILPGARLVSVDSYAAGQTLLQNGEVDAFAGDASVLTGWTQSLGPLENYTVLPTIISAEPLAIALPKGSQHRDLQTAVNQAIRAWYAEEWLQERAVFWALPSGRLQSGRLQSGRLQRGAAK
ncbi:MAG: transporter substrate-binding domain-containing protein [Cyanobacteria bacterium J06560_2]